MTALFKNATVFYQNRLQKLDIFVKNGLIVEISETIAAHSGIRVVDCRNDHIFPGFTDVHVHLREPGFSYKETIQSGTLAAAHGGYTTVCAMPNLNPVPDCAKNLAVQLDLIKKNAVIRVIPYGAVTKGELGKELSDMASMAGDVVGFSDDGHGVQSDEMMAVAMQEAKQLQKPIVAHCEINHLLNGGYIHQGVYAQQHGHKGICSESEYGQVARDIDCVRRTGCKYHVCHVSTKESVELIRRAKADGLDVSGETAPHYLVLCEEDLQEDGRFKMNPPLRSKQDKQALIKGIQDGTIEVIATDHAPHSAAEKSRGLAKSAMGIVGLETAFSVLYTHLVRNGVITLESLVTLLSTKPNKRFDVGTVFDVGNAADFCLYDLDDSYTINPETFCSMGRATPFAGQTVYGRCKLTVCNGEIVWRDL